MLATTAGRPGVEESALRALCKCSWILSLSFQPPGDPDSPGNQPETPENPTRKRDTEKTEKPTL